MRDQGKRFVRALIVALVVQTVALSTSAAAGESAKPGQGASAAELFLLTLLFAASKPASPDDVRTRSYVAADETREYTKPAQIACSAPARDGCPDPLAW